MSRKVMIEVEDNDFDDFIERGIVRAEVVRNATLMYESDDAVSRQAVLKINEKYHGEMTNHINFEIWNEIKALPPVLPKREENEVKA